MTNELEGFIEAARREGASDQVVVELLRHEGWSDKEIYAALGAYYERRTGIAVPARKISHETARDAFLYLLSFFTLGAWTIALGSLWFSLIESWFPDALARSRELDFRHALPRPWPRWWSRSPCICSRSG